MLSRFSSAFLLCRLLCLCMWIFRQEFSNYSYTDASPDPYPSLQIPWVWVKGMGGEEDPNSFHQQHREKQLSFPSCSSLRIARLLESREMGSVTARGCDHTMLPHYLHPQMDLAPLFSTMEGVRGFWGIGANIFPLHTSSSSCSKPCLPCSSSLNKIY